MKRTASSKKLASLENGELVATEVSDHAKSVRAHSTAPVDTKMPMNARTAPSPSKGRMATKKRRFINS